MYSHPSEVPVDCALALHRVLHNMASPDDWDLLDKWVRKKGLDTVVDLIVQTLRMNGVNRNGDERKWWVKELRRNGN